MLSFCENGSAAFNSTVSAKVLSLHNGSKATFANDATFNALVFASDYYGKEESTIELQNGAIFTVSGSSESNNHDVCTLTFDGNGQVIIQNSFINKYGIRTTADWNGTITLEDCTFGGLSFRSDKESDSDTVRVNGISGWLEQNLNMNCLLEIGEKGLTITDSSQKYSFSGGIRGEGDFIIATKSSNTNTWKYTGSLSEWDGAIRVQPHETAEALPDVNLELTAGGMLFSGKEGSGIMMERLGTVNVSMGNTSSATTFRGAILNKGVTVNGATSYGTLNLSLVSGSTTTFEKEVDVTQLTVEADASAIFEGSVRTDSVVLSEDTDIELTETAEMTASDVTGGQLQLNGAGTYKLGTATQLHANVALGENWSGTVQVKDTTISQNADVSALRTANSALALVNVNLAENVKVTVDADTSLSADHPQAGISNVEIRRNTLRGLDAEASLENMTLEGFAEEYEITDLNMLNVKVDALRTTLRLTGVTFDDSCSFSVGETGVIVLSDATLHITLPTLTEGENTLYVDLSALFACTVKGELTLAVDTEALRDAEYSYIEFNFGSATTEDYSGLRVSLNGSPAISLEDNAVAFTVPEPSTGTLSLLALTGLAMRRRRK